MFPIVTSFQTTNIRNAFILNSLVAAFTTVIAIWVHHDIEFSNSQIQKMVQYDIGKYGKIVITFLIAFLSSFIVYHILHLIFGFGLSMLNTSPIKNLPKYAA